MTTWDDERDLAALALVGQAVPPLTPSVALRRRILASVRPESRYAGFHERLAALFDLGAGRLEEILAEARHPGGDAWVATPVPGLRVLYLEGGPNAAGSVCAFVHMEPGTPFPSHEHAGPERALILAGVCAESRGGLFLPGDTLEMETDSEHALRAEGGEPLVFAVAHNGIAFRSA